MGNGILAGTLHQSHLTAPTIAKTMADCFPAYTPEAKARAASAAAAAAPKYKEDKPLAVKKKAVRKRQK